MVDAVTFGGVRLSASMDVTSGKLLPAGQPGEYKAGGNYTLDDASPVYVEAILMPVGTAEGITVNVHVDGRDFTYALPPTHVWNPGMIYTYTPVSYTHLDVYKRQTSFLRRMVALPLLPFSPRQQSFPEQRKFPGPPLS